MKLFVGSRVRRACLLSTWMMLMTTSSVLAQATSTFNGRVLDQGDAVLPGVTITATNISTGVAAPGWLARLSTRVRNTRTR